MVPIRAHAHAAATLVELNADPLAKITVGVVFQRILNVILTLTAEALMIVTPIVKAGQIAQHLKGITAGVQTRDWTTLVLRLI